jgi:hypothetical protein
MVVIGFHARAVSGPVLATGVSRRVTGDCRGGQFLRPGDPLRSNSDNLSGTADCGNLYASPRVHCLSPYAQSSYQLT